MNKDPFVNEIVEIINKVVNKNSDDWRAKLKKAQEEHKKLVRLLYRFHICKSRNAQMEENIQAKNRLIEQLENRLEQIKFENERLRSKRRAI